MDYSRRQSTERAKILFEPWALGDVIIATSVYRESPESFAIVTHSKWIPLLDLLFPGSKPGSWIGLDLGYTTRTRNGPFDFGRFKFDNDLCLSKGEVLSIRGDIRDYLAARKLFPGSRIRMTGWWGYLARRCFIADLPYRRGWMPVRNRYKAWAELAGISFGKVLSTYHESQECKLPFGKVFVHVGAQWRSKQWPEVASLKAALLGKGWDIEILAGPEDGLPRSIDESEVTRVGIDQLVERFRDARIVIANDSGPMHLAAFLGCQTIAIARASNIEEWIPPGVIAMTAPQMPKGYKPDRLYQTDLETIGWPSAEAVMKQIESIACLGKT